MGHPELGDIEDDPLRDRLIAHSRVGDLDGRDTGDVRALAGAGQRAIEDKRAEMGIGDPVGDIESGPDGGFSRSYASATIYWHQATGAHYAHGAILERFRLLGAERGPLGYPATDELSTVDGMGRLNHFQRGSIYWHPSTGAHEVHGAIRDAWAALGWERFGFPTCDEAGAADGVGRVNHFVDAAGDGDERSIYWTPTLGAHAIQGPIRRRWAELGWERSYLGYPTSNQHQQGNGYGNTFQRGRITVSDQLRELPDGVSHTLGRTSVGTAHVSASLHLQSDGGTAFCGQIHESGVFGEHFLVAAALLDVVDDQGRVAVFTHEDTVVGQLEIGYSDKEWRTFGRVDAIVADWGRAKNSRVEFRVKVSTDPLQVTEAIIAALFVAVGSIFVVHQVTTCPEGEHLEGGWVVESPGDRPPVWIPGRPDESPTGASATYKTECRPN